MIETGEFNERGDVLLSGLDQMSVDQIRVNDFAVPEACLRCFDKEKDSITLVELSDEFLLVMIGFFVLAVVQITGI